MSLLASITTPTDLDALSWAELDELAAEIRTFLVKSVSATGGHLGPNLGVVELTMALHLVFDSPRDSIVFDTGHISYVHKLLTGRQDFGRLRSAGGLSGYPSREESEHDIVENSHASTSLAWAEGIAKGRRLRGETDACTVAVIGDGALTGGMAWEALNDIAADKDLPLVIVVNDNERSYAPTTGGLAEHLAVLRATRSYEQVMSWGRRTVESVPVVGPRAFEALHGMKKGLKDIIAPQVLFEDLGLKYLGPIDGHDVDALATVLRRARDFGGPVIVHAITQKGRGYQHALDNADDAFHAVGVINPETGLPLEIAGRSWTENFSDTLVELGEERQDVVAITAAMLIPVGLREFAEAHPDRVLDVGIAEQHATTMAAGLSFAGMHPVVAIYATFLNRAFDQMLMDCALHGQGVTFVLDRAGVTGSDGASHNGMWDFALASVVPGIRVAAPRDGVRVGELLREAVAIEDGPTVLRFPKGTEPEPIPALDRIGGLDVVARHGLDDVADPDVLLVAVGAMAPVATGAASLLADQGLRVLVVDPRWVLPVSEDLVALARTAGYVGVVEDHVAANGIGSAVAAALAETGEPVTVHRFGLPKTFFTHDSRNRILADAGLTAPAVADAVLASVRPTDTPA
ncbi:1-deoxy-D-xylulose-5-phosphate synthase [Mobilicoccus pelagius]|uniref:1-deoxy-D-xylulose-5-phosphate synthase n=1 Tax=Mobilicoccus pelagius NBRC 104925 TaxID=1089455 RepID=H5UUK9_9MICO|nr:1-deoxy-D-xylulose-5-phosphate synthase [Mobilicoccus pelagius]GAB49417.1 1-deoxy-D-xylulose-5-phosphate synthase [Mobilicoccus pelagius NBRC 104925]